MAIDLTWLVGCGIITVRKNDHTWVFHLDDGSAICTEGTWRLVTGRVIVTSEDDKQLFGLPAPVNAAEIVTRNIGKSLVHRFELGERTGDLSLYFDNGAMVQFLTLSSGYEGWRISHGDQSIILLGGGDLAVYGPK